MVPGPAILIDAISTIVVEPGWAAYITAEGNVRMDRAQSASGGERGKRAERSAGAAAAAEAAAPEMQCDPIQLAIFSHR